MDNQNVGIRDLKSRLSDYLKKVKKGTSITITDHGKPVGRIIPIVEPKKNQIDVLIESGLAEWSLKPLESKSPLVENKGALQISDILLDMRE
jgi:prevent-host-death family protein